MACLAMNNTPGAILAALLAFDTTSRHSNLAMIDWIADFLAARGVASHRFYDPSGGKANLYARLGPSGGGGVMLSGHTDVVPVDGQDWSVPPFSLTERDGRYYGRGSADMKGFLACVLAAVDDFLAAPLRMPLHLAFSYDEEVGCLGVRSLVDFLQASPEKPALCLIGEPTEMQPVFGHKGKLAMRCCIEGQACHSAYAPQGVNAIRYAARLINRLDRLGARLARQQDSRLFAAFQHPAGGHHPGRRRAEHRSAVRRLILKSATCRGCVPKRLPKRWRPTPAAGCCRRCAGSAAGATSSSSC